MINLTQSFIIYAANEIAMCAFFDTGFVYEIVKINYDFILTNFGKVVIYREIDSTFLKNQFELIP